MIQYNNSTNSGRPTNPYIQPNASYSTANRKKSGGIGGLVWIVVVLMYFGFSRATGGGMPYMYIILMALAAVGIFVAVIIKNAKKNGGTAAPRRSSQDGHICETPSEHSASERSAADTLDEMEEGYRAYSYSAAETSAHESYVYKRIKKMTPEEYRKKLEELDSLLAAGMMTREEYHAKKQEYAGATRGV